MAESKLHTARVQVVEAMEQGLPWHEAAKREKKVTSPAGEPEWQEGAGGVLRLSAAHETARLSQLEDVLPMKQQSSSVSPPAPQRLLHPQRSLLLTLLFLPAVGLHRFWEVRSSTAGELALLTGRAPPYSYRHTERFLLTLSAAQADQALTEALARWRASVWQVEERSRDASSPHFYVDGHRKPVYTETLIPRGLIGRLGKIAGCRALVLLHDEQGVNEVQPRLPDGRFLILHASSSPFG